MVTDGFKRLSRGLAMVAVLAFVLGGVFVPLAVLPDLWSSVYGGVLAVVGLAWLLGGKRV